MRRYWWVILLLALGSGAKAGSSQTQPAPAAQAPPPNYGCPGPEYRQLDFWLGKWSVTTMTSNTLAGASEVTLLDKGCAILESWSGTNGGTGHSLNVFDQADGKWHQTWVSSTGNQVHYIGVWKDGKMQLAADDISTPQRTPAKLTMTFEPRPDGTVRQLGTLSTDDGKTLNSSFDLIYTRIK